MSAAAVYAGKQAIDAATTQQNAENKLTEIYRSRMGATRAAAKATEEYASKLQREGVVGDEVTLSGAQQLATFAKMPETVNKLLPAMDNLLVQQKGYAGTAQDATQIANLMKGYNWDCCVYAENKFVAVGSVPIEGTETYKVARAESKYGYEWEVTEIGTYNAPPIKMAYDGKGNFVIVFCRRILYETFQPYGGMRQQVILSLAMLH